METETESRLLRVLAAQYPAPNNLFGAKTGFAKVETAAEIRLTNTSKTVKHWHQVVIFGPQTILVPLEKWLTIVARYKLVTITILLG
jgi:hypothetical protein